MRLSGSIGVIILEKNNKKICLLSDDHSNSLYCSNNQNDHMDIDDFLKEKFNEGNQILLEEVPRDGFDLKELWPDSPHTQSLKDLFLDDTNNISGVDIRPYLIPFSWDVIEVEGKKSNLIDLPILDYMIKIREFMNKKGKFYEKIFEPAYKKLIVKNSGLGRNLIDICNNYDEILKVINDTNIEPNKKTISYYLENNKSLFYSIDKLCDMIMEFYIILLSFTTCKPSYIHSGLFHSSNILNYLIDVYRFSVIYKHGTISFPTNNDNIVSCTLLPNNDNFGII
tara:strand:+ start:539 stop:1384 length:846 start_codon:yes stop_codon:yes gene_type:complete